MKFFYSILIILFIVVLPFLVVYFYEFYKQSREKDLPKKRTFGKKDSILKKIYYLLPKRLVLDRFNQNPDSFPMYGLHLVVGEQGSGKTIAVTEMLMRLKNKYPNVKIRTNYNYIYENGQIEDWRSLVHNDNGELGQIEVIDEVQNWFNSLQSKDFPIEMFGEITQQRKQRKMIVGTSQVWGRVAKPLREQCFRVYKPVTFFGALTWVRVFKPDISQDGSIDNLRYLKMYFFVHNDKIRLAFDTYKKIEVMSAVGFKPALEQYSALRSQATRETQSELPSNMPKFFKKSK